MSRLGSAAKNEPGEEDAQQAGSGRQDARAVHEPKMPPVIDAAAVVLSGGDEQRAQDGLLLLFLLDVSTVDAPPPSPERGRRPRVRAWVRRAVRFDGQ